MVLNDMGSDSDEENFLSQLKKKAKKHAIVENYDRPAKFQQFGSGLSGGGIPDRAHRIGNY